MSEDVKEKSNIKKYNFTETSVELALSRYLIPFYRKKYGKRRETLKEWKKLLKVK